MEDYSQAVSFANGYFSLVDGLAPGIENHLAENVVLDWFGKTIRGKRNVTDFIKAHKFGSRHVFKNITSIPDINYTKYQQNNRKNPIVKTDNSISNDLLKKELNFAKLSIEDDSPTEFDPENNNVLIEAPSDYIHHDHHPSDISIIDFDQNLQLQSAINEDLSTTYDLGENDLANLFALEITPARYEEIEKNISQIQNSALDSSTSSVEYVEANGHIEFSKKSNKRGADLQTWRRQSRLQISYSKISPFDFRLSAGETGSSDEGMTIETESLSPFKKYHKNIPHKFTSLLPSLGEITEISNNLVPTNSPNSNFGGYFPSSFDFANERDKFLDNLNAELNPNKSTAYLRTPQYVDNRLVFRKFDFIKNSIHDHDKREANEKFVFNYIIHLIIYQGNSKCRRSLSHEFELPNKNKKLFCSTGLEEF